MGLSCGILYLLEQLMYIVILNWLDEVPYIIPASRLIIQLVLLIRKSGHSNPRVASLCPNLHIGLESVDPRG